MLPWPLKYAASASTSAYEQPIVERTRCAAVISSVAVLCPADVPSVSRAVATPWTFVVKVAGLMLPSPLVAA